jgi:hypothetical protein
MTANLNAPRAKLKWANDQIIILHAQLAIFFNRKPYRVIHEPNPNGRGAILKLQSVESLPSEIPIQVGAILAAQRESLDFLVTALAEKNGAKEPRDVCFPIADSKARFLEKGTQKKIAKLAPEDRDIIGSVKPYKGGNDLLYALNWLCQKGKHRKPILIGGVANSVGIGGTGIVRSIQILGFRDCLETGAPVAIVDADPGIKLNFSMDVAFREVAGAHLRPIIPTLREFGRLTAAIIDLFS